MSDIKSTYVGFNQSSTYDQALKGNASTIYFTSDHKGIVLNGQPVDNITKGKSTTLSWGSSTTIGSINGTDFTVTMPANPNTDTMVTSPANHYSPIALDDYQITKKATGGGTTASGATTQVMNGLTVTRDAKGHVVDVTISSVGVKDTVTTNTDTKVNLTEDATDASSYIMLSKDGKNGAQEGYYSSKVMINRKTGAITSNGGFVGNLTGNADKATKLATGRSIQTNLSIETAPTFDGTTPITPGVTGTLPVKHGGTGSITLAANAVLTGNGTSAVKTIATKSGAFYATEANTAPTFGTLPVKQGGTGATTAADARTKLEVYSTTEVDNKIKTITLSSMKGMRFIGVASAEGDTSFDDGSTFNTVYVGGTIYTAVKGDVVVQGTLEYIYDGSMWKLFGIPKVEAEGSTETLSWNTTSTIGSIKDTSGTTKTFAVKMPSNPNVTSTIAVGTSGATSNTKTALTNGNVYLNHVEGGKANKSVKISGTGATEVKTDASGNIIINSTNTDTKVTSELNHYTPSGSKEIGNTNGGNHNEFLTSLNIDNKGHIVNWTSSTIPTISLSYTGPGIVSSLADDTTTSYSYIAYFVGRGGIDVTGDSNNYVYIDGSALNDQITYLLSALSDLTSVVNDLSTSVAKIDDKITNIDTRVTALETSNSKFTTLLTWQ